MKSYDGFNRRSNMAARVLFQKAQDLFINGKHRESIDAYTEFMTLKGETEIGLLSRGVAYLKIGQPEKAIDDFSRVIEINSLNVRAYYYRGVTFLIKAEYEKAIPEFDKTIALQPDHGAAFFARGTAYAQIGNEFEASRNIKAAISLSEADIEGLPDTIGMIRTQFNSAMAKMTEHEKIPSTTLTDDEINRVMQWLEEHNH